MLAGEKGITDSEDGGNVEGPVRGPLGPSQPIPPRAEGRTAATLLLECGEGLPVRVGRGRHRSPPRDGKDGKGQGGIRPVSQEKKQPEEATRGFFCLPLPTPICRRFF